jgi:hypothetical protein
MTGKEPEAPSVLMFTFSRDQFEEEINRVKDMIITQLFEEKMISDETRFEWLSQRAYIIRQPNFFGRIWDAIAKQGSMRYILVEQKNMVLQEPEKEEKKGKLILLKSEPEKKE